MIITSKKYSSVLRLFVIILLIFAMIFVSCVGNYAQGFAIPVPLIGVIATILIGSGLSFTSDADLEAAANAFGNFVTGDAAAELSAMATEYQSVVNGSFKFKVTPKILGALGDWLASQEWTFSETGSGEFSVPGGSEAIFQGLDFSDVFKPNYSCLDLYQARSEIRKNNPGLSNSEVYRLLQEQEFFPANSIPSSLIDKPFYYKGNAGSTGFYKFQFIDGIYSYISCDADGNTGSSPATELDYLAVFSSHGFEGPGRVYGPYILYLNYFEMTLHLNYNGVNGSVTTFPNSNVISDTTYFPKEVTSSGVGMTTFPENTASQPLTTDIPLTIPETGVDVNTGVGDVRGEAETGELDHTGTITSDGTGTGIFEGIGSWILSIPILGDLLKILGQILEAILSFFDVSQFELDLTPLKCGLTTVFPFCIPFDFLRAIEVFAADSSSFSFDIDLDTKYFKIDHTVDLSPFALPIAFFRYVVVFWFGYILISRTRDLIKW